MYTRPPAQDVPDHVDLGVAGEQVLVPGPVQAEGAHDSRGGEVRHTQHVAQLVDNNLGQKSK